ncbi:MAG: transcriptional activator of cad operon [Glaciecola sp.]
MQDSLLQYFGESDITFDQFSIKTPSGEVLKEGQVIKLEPQVLSFLLLLIRRKEHVVSREEIITEVWAGKKASDDAIRALVKKLRIALGDNARAPKFVKTVPLQGYLFIMPVELEFNQTDWWRSKYFFYGISAGIIILITLLVQAQFGSFQANPEKSLREVSISKITEMKGSEVSPYLSKNNKLLFSHRGDGDQSLQLYVKDLNSMSLKRLTWGVASFTDGIFSPDASQAIISKHENGIASLLLFNFDQAFNITGVELIELDESFDSQKVSAISYSTNGGSLYLFADALTNQDINSDISRGLIHYNVESKNSVVLVFPLTTDSIIIDAIESDDGKLLAVLTHTDGKAEIHVQNLATKEIILSKIVPELPSSMVWAADGRSMTFATNKGNLLNLNIPKELIYLWSGLPMDVSEVVSECGEYCFVVKEQESDLLNVVERPSPFKEQIYISTRQFSLASTDRFPSYFDAGKGIFFISLSDNKLVLNRYVDGGDVEAIYELPKTNDFNTLILSPDEKVFAGELDGRIFLYNLNNGAFSFLTSASVNSKNPVWSLHGDELFYQQVTQNKSVIYAQDIVSNKIRVKAEGLIFIKPLDSTRWLLVDEKRQAYLYQNSIQATSVTEGEKQIQPILVAPTGMTVFSNETLSASLKFAELDNISSNGFDVENEALFFINTSANSSFLNKLELETSTLETVELKAAAILHQLDIHPNTQKMLTVEYSLSQSNLLKVDGLILESRQVNLVITETP